MNNTDNKLINITNNNDYDNINFFNFDLDINNIQNNNQLEGNNNVISNCIIDNSKYILINFNYLNSTNFLNPNIPNNINNINNTIPLNVLINNINNILNKNKNIIISLDTFLDDLLKSFKDKNDINKQLELDFHRSLYFINYKKIYDLEQLTYYFEYKTLNSSHIIYNKFNIIDIIYAIHTQAVLGSIYEYIYKILKNLDIHIVDISKFNNNYNNNTNNNSLSFYTNIYNNNIFINISKRMKIISLNYKNSHIDLGEIKIDINFSFYINETNFVNNEYVYFNIIYNKN